MRSNRRFYMLLWAVLFVGLAVAALLAFALLNSGPRLRSVTPTDDLYGKPTASGQIVQLTFNRPLQEADYSAKIRVEPEAAYRVSQSGNRLIVSFTENLLQDTTYTLTVDAGVGDIDGRLSHAPQSSTFKTGPPRLLYVQRAQDAADELRWFDLSSKASGSHFTADTIKFFAANSAYIAVAVEHEDLSNGLVVIDRKTGAQSVVSGIDGLTFASLRLARTSPIVAFVATSPEAAQQLYLYDISTGQLHGGRREVTTIAPTPDGQHVVYQLTNGLAYAQNARDPSEPPILLGSFITISDFDQSGTKILLQSVDGVEVYDASTRQRSPIAGLTTADSALAFMPGSDSILYRNYQPGRAEPTIEARQGETVVTSFEPPADHYFFGQPRASVDGRYIVAETASSDDRLDDYRLNPKPKSAMLRIFDRNENRYLELTLPGVDPIFE